MRHKPCQQHPSKSADSDPAPELLHGELTTPPALSRDRCHHSNVSTVKSCAVCGLTCSMHGWHSWEECQTRSHSLIDLSWMSAQWKTSTQSLQFLTSSSTGTFKVCCSATCAYLVQASCLIANAIALKYSEADCGNFNANQAKVQLSESKLSSSL